jgi:hypothetical protein
MIDNEANPPGIKHEFPRLVRQTPERGNRDLRVGAKRRPIS